jgi:hypothetical protein
VWKEFVMAGSRSTDGRSSGSRRGGRSRGADGTRREVEKVIQEHQEDDSSLGERESPFHRPPWYRAFSFGLITAGLFAFSWVGQLLTQITVETQEAKSHGQSFSWNEFWPQFFASTFENWQSEFLQLCWQALGLGLFYFWGSSQSKEQDERLEMKIDLLLRDRGFDTSKL